MAPPRLKDIFTLKALKIAAIAIGGATTLFGLGKTGVHAVHSRLYVEEHRLARGAFEKVCSREGETISDAEYAALDKCYDHLPERAIGSGIMTVLGTTLAVAGIWGLKKDAPHA